jgi:hypothetical protein
MSSSWLALFEMLLVVGGVGCWAAWELRTLRREVERREARLSKSGPEEPSDNG